MRGGDREPGELLGILEVLPSGSGFIRRADDGYVPGKNDIYVGSRLIHRFGLRTGDELAGIVGRRPRNGKSPPLRFLDLVNGLVPDSAARRPDLNRLSAMHPREHRVDARGEGLGVAGGHEDGARPRVGIGDAPERSDPNRGPQARLEQQLAHVVAAEPGGMPARERGEPDRGAATPLLLVPAEGDDDGPEAAALPAVDRLYGAGGRRREPDAGPLLVLEEQLAAADVVALRDVHGGPEADVVVGH